MHNASMRNAAFHLISLRPVAGHAGLRRAAAKKQGRVLAMSPWRLMERREEGVRRDVRVALACPCVVFTSPAAVHAAARLQGLKPKRGQAYIGVGEGTRRVLQRAGVTKTISPSRMDSEGVLALPAIDALRRGDSVGLVTAPGGRGEIARQLRARGIRIVRADVYERVPVTITAARWQALQQKLVDATSPTLLALSSGEALGELLRQAPPGLLKPLRRVTVIAASERLATLARKHGFRRIVVAASARPDDMVAAINAAG